MSEPLDLRALEARLKFGDSLDAAECGALVAALRRTRAALSPTLRGVRDEEALAWYDEAVAALASVSDVPQE